jgi:hypothetical protein
MEVWRMKTLFAPCELPSLKKGDRRYMFDTKDEAIEFIEGVARIGMLDDRTVMVVRLSTDNQWAIDFEVTQDPVEAEQQVGTGCE